MTLREARIKAGLSVAKLAEEVFVCAESIRNYESGKTRMMPDTAERIEAVIGDFDYEPYIPSIREGFRHEENPYWKARVERGMTVRDVSEKIHACAAAISNWETGKRKPSKKSKEKLEKLFGKIFD